VTEESTEEEEQLTEEEPSTEPESTTTEEEYEQSSSDGDDGSTSSSSSNNDGSSSSSSSNDGSSDDGSRSGRILTYEETVLRADLTHAINCKLDTLRGNRRICNRRHEDTGKKRFTRERKGNLSFDVNPNVLALVVDHFGTQLSSKGKETQAVFFTQIAQFFAFASSVVDLTQEANEVTIIPMMVKVCQYTCPVSHKSVIQLFTDWLKGQDIAYDTIRGRLSNLLSLMGAFTGYTMDQLQMYIPIHVTFIKNTMSVLAKLVWNNKRIVQAETLCDTGLLCVKADLIEMNKALVPLLTDIMQLATLQTLSLAWYTLALRIMFFLFYSSNENGRFQAISALTHEQGKQLIAVGHTKSSATKCFTGHGPQYVTCNEVLRGFLDSYARLLRPADTNSTKFFIRYNGNSVTSGDGSKGIGTMTEDLFGLYLPVTTLRAISSTAVKMKADKGQLNAAQCNTFHERLQGHSSITAQRCYTMLSRANVEDTLDNINKVLNAEEHNECVLFTPAYDPPHETPGQAQEVKQAPEEQCTGQQEEHLLPQLKPRLLQSTHGQHQQQQKQNTGQQEEQLLRQLQQQIDSTAQHQQQPPGPMPEQQQQQSPGQLQQFLVKRSACSVGSYMSPLSSPSPKKIKSVYDDFGRTHPDYMLEEARYIRWSEEEINYLKRFLAESPRAYSECLNSILRNEDSNIRNIFHPKHIKNSSVLRDGIRDKI
jgi:hypothetical protein